MNESREKKKRSVPKLLIGAEERIRVRVSMTLELNPEKDHRNTSKWSKNQTFGHPNNPSKVKMPKKSQREKIEYI